MVEWGLSQVLVASDGVTTTYNLFGLDLIHQDDGATTRTLLADGLGSARTEMAGGAVATVTTYEPFGNPLAQTGTSGTVYGFTGEQHDAATGLVYLRARYYAPSLRVFLSRDPYPGSSGRPATQNGYSYVSNNSVNKTDPSGLCEEVGDEACWNLYEQIVRRYPEAKNKIYFYNGQWVSLDDLPWSTLCAFLQELDNAQPGYFTSNQLIQNNFTIRRPDAVGVYGSIHGADAIFSGQTGIEVIYNLHSADLTLFAVVGFGGSIGADLTGQLQFLAIYNIDGKNLDYSGNFVGLGGQASAEFGLGGQYSITPEDARELRIFTPKDAFSIGIGPVCGYGLSGGASVVEYIPVITTNIETHKTTYHLTDYFYDHPVPGNPEGQFNNGFITGLATEDMPHYYRLIQDKIEEYGWSGGSE